MSVMQLAKKPIYDAAENMAIKITATDVKTGSLKDPTKCAAARACIREFGALSARVHVSRTYLEYEDHWVRFETPLRLRTEIISFDRGMQFVPGEYELKAPCKSHTAEALKANADKRKRGKGAKPKTPKQRAYHKVQGIRHDAHRV